MSHELTRGFNIDGREFNIPTVHPQTGKRLTNQEAVDRFISSGDIRSAQSFGSVQEAEVAAKARSNSFNSTGEHMQSEDQKDFEFLADRFRDKFDVEAAAKRGMPKEDQARMLFGLQKQREMVLDEQQKAQEAGAASSPFDTFRAGLHKGAGKIILGATQLGSEALNTISPDLVSDEFVQGLGEVAKEEANEPVFAAMREQNPKSALAGEIGGEVAFTLPTVVGGPALGGVKAGAGAGRAAFAGRGAVEGAAIGALQPVQDTENFAGNKLIDTTIGAAAGTVGGAAAPEINAFLGFLGRKGADGVKFLQDLGKRVGGRFTDDGVNFTAKAEQIIRDEGIDPAKAKEILKQALEDEKNFSKLTPEQKTRFETFEAQGVQPLKGDITQNPADQSRFERLRKVGTEEGTEAQALLEKREQGISGAVNRLADDTGGLTDDLEEIGFSLSEPARVKSRQTQTEVSKAYNKVRESGGDKAIVPKDDFLASTDEIIADFEDVIPGPIINRIKRIAEGDDLTIGEAEKLRKLIGQRQATADPAGKEGLRQLKDALDDSVTVAGEGFTAGRRKAAERFKSQEAAEARKAAGKVSVDDIISGKIPDEKIPDKLISKTTTSKDFSKIIDFFESGTATQKAAGKKAIANIKRFMIIKAFKAATKGGHKVGESGTRRFSGKQFGKELDKMAKKLNRVMTKQEKVALGQLKRIGDLTELIEGAGNPSGTEAAIFNRFMDFAEVIPGVRFFRNIAKAAEGGGKKRAEETIVKSNQRPFGSIAKENKGKIKQQFRDTAGRFTRPIPASTAALVLELRGDN